MFRNLVWKFDIFVYKLFYLRWNKKLAEREDIRDLFAKTLEDWGTQQKAAKKGVV